MSAHLKAFIVVFAIAVLALVLLRKPFATLIGSGRYNRWAFLWLTIVICAYFVTNFWIFALVSGLIIFAAAATEPVKPAIYMMLLCATPYFGLEIPGFAGINKFIEVTPQLVLAVAVLIPLMLSAKHMKKLAPVGGGADLFFLLWLLFISGLTFREPTFTHTLRVAIEQFLAIAPLYYVLSRSPKSLDSIRIISAAYVLAILVLSATAIFELVRGWRLYDTVIVNWFGNIPFNYVVRDGMLRASASTFNPIVWGYVAMTAIGVGLATFHDRMSPLYRWAGFGVLAGGLVASLSRGPWVGAVAIVGIFVIIGPKKVSTIMRLGSAGFVAGVAAMFTPFGQRLIDMMPFLQGQVDETISYRQRLLEAAWPLILENPIFGRQDYLEASELQHLRQGQGIIDIVNTYLQVGLKSGLVGLILFTGFFVFVLKSLRTAYKSAANYDPQLALYCRAYFATLAGIMITIFTTSSEHQIPHIYWSVAGLGLALARIEHAARNNAATPEIDPPAETQQPAYDWK